MVDYREILRLRSLGNNITLYKQKRNDLQTGTSGYNSAPCILPTFR